MADNKITSEDALRVGSLVRVLGFKVKYGRIIKLYPDGLADVQFNIRVEAKHLSPINAEERKR